MLIVRRRRGESITIGDEIEIEILDISPTQVKVGIRAPKDVGRPTSGRLFAGRFPPFTGLTWKWMV